MRREGSAGLLVEVVVETVIMVVIVWHPSGVAQVQGGPVVVWPWGSSGGAIGKDSDEE